MPQLICKGLKREVVAKMSKDLPEILSKISDTPEDYFTFECPTTTYFSKGKESAMYPLIEIIQYQRSHEVEREMARAVSDYIQSAGYEICEVYFIHVGNCDYYEF